MPRLFRSYYDFFNVSGLVLSHLNSADRDSLKWTEQKLLRKDSISLPIIIIFRINESCVDRIFHDYRHN